MRFHINVLVLIYLPINKITTGQINIWLFPSCHNNNQIYSIIQNFIYLQNNCLVVISILFNVCSLKYIFYIIVNVQNAMNY